ncbi:hypothetical protein GA0074695_2958 [Micromonospora viridifaciens]|uniref:Uncharacterized protein n=1 Tax=Micromonospora viridifaciens TaxID=1881 RepID=A0A1C4X2P4_MICVI|nr:hypothetical protein GA0074695_2958 [Micromonospora viridifaciens]
MREHLRAGLRPFRETADRPSQARRVFKVEVRFQVRCQRTSPPTTVVMTLVRSTASGDSR